MPIEIRKFNESDIPFKVKWINDPENNQFLHYDLPLEEEKTLKWFNANKERKDRADFTILYNGEPAGIIGLLNIDNKNKKAEYYITLGGSGFKGKGIATKASKLLIKESHEKYNLNKIYLYTEVDNTLAQNLFERIGFKKEGQLSEDLIQDNKKINRYVYGLLVAPYLKEEKN